MNALLSIAVLFALILSSCCGHETNFSDGHPAETYEYEYEYTGDYSSFPEAELYIPNKASGIDQLNLLLLLGLAVLQIWN